MEWYEVKNVDEIDTPALLIYKDRAETNIRRAIEEVGIVDRLRPHVKTHKSAKVTALMLDAGITKFKCSTIAEAEMLAKAGAPDILIAYQLNEPKLRRFIALMKNFNSRFSCLFDNSDTLKMYSRLAREADVKISVYLDLNVGMNRTGIAPGEEALALYKEAVDLPGVNMEGLHVYDGHIRNTNLEERTRVANEAFIPVEKMISELLQKGYLKPKIVAGGSPTFPIHAKNPEVEASPGTFVFWDWGYKHTVPDLPFEYAALVMTRVISLPAPGLICVDLGHKSIAAENELSKRVYFLNAPNLKPVSQSEEHLVLDVGEQKFKVGDVLYGVPHHICPTCALYDFANIIVDHNKTDEWEISARDRRITI